MMSSKLASTMSINFNKDLSPFKRVYIIGQFTVQDMQDYLPHFLSIFHEELLFDSFNPNIGIIVLLTS